MNFKSSLRRAERAGENEAAATNGDDPPDLLEAARHKNRWREREQ